MSQERLGNPMYLHQIMFVTTLAGGLFSSTQGQNKIYNVSDSHSLSRKHVTLQKYT